MASESRRLRVVRKEASPAFEVPTGEHTLSPGRFLREQRKSRGMSVEQLATLTKIPRSSLLQLERDQHESLPGPVFVRGFLRCCARVLHSDEAELLRLFEAYEASTGGESPAKTCVNFSAPGNAGSAAEPGRSHGVVRRTHKDGGVEPRKPTSGSGVPLAQSAAHSAVHKPHAPSSSAGSITAGPSLPQVTSASLGVQVYAWMQRYAQLFVKLLVNGSQSGMRLSQGATFMWVAVGMLLTILVLSAVQMVGGPAVATLPPS